MNRHAALGPSLPVLPLFLALGTVCAAGAQAQTAGSAFRTQTIAIAPFTPSTEEERLEEVARAIPGLLEAGLLPFRWIRSVRYEGSSPVLEPSRLGASKGDYLQRQTVETREPRAGGRAAAASTPDADFWIRGRVIPLRQGVVIDVSLVSGRTRSVVYTDVAETSVDELLPTVGKLARRIGERLRREAGVVDPVTPGPAANVVRVESFRPEGGADRFANLGDLFAEHLVSSLESLVGNDPGRRLTVTMAGTEEQAPDPGGGVARIRGSFEVANGEDVIVTGRLEEAETGVSVAVHVHGRVDDVFALPRRLAESIFELLEARIDADGTLRPASELLLEGDAEALVARGDELARQNDLPGAVLHYWKAVDLDPTRVDAYVGLGETYTEGGRYDEAMEVLEEADRLEPASLAVDVAVADLHLRRGEVEAAAERLRGAATGAGADHRLRARAHKLLGDALRLSGESEAALEAYEEALHLDPSDPSPYLSAADLYRTLGDPESAVDVLEDGREGVEGDVAALSAELAGAYSDAGDVHLDAGRVDRAEEYWERAVELAPPGTRTRAIALRSLGSSAAYAREEPDLERAAEFLRRSVAEDSTDAWTRHLLGLVHLDSNRSDLAIAELRTAAEMDPSELTFGDLGRAFRSTGEFDEAIAALERAVSIAPDFAWGHAEMGETYRLMGENEEAARALQRAIELEPDYAWAWGTLGQVHRARDDLDAAVGALETAVSLDDTQTWILLELGEAYRLQGDHDRAIPPLRRALEQEPENAWGWGTLGQVYRAQNRQKEAIDALERAASLQGGEVAWIHGELGRTYLEVGEVDAAIEALRTAIDLYPEHEAYYDWLWIAYTRQERHADLAQELERLADDHREVPRIRTLLGHLYHDYLLEYDRALQQLEEAFELAETPDHAANLAEAYLTNERFSVAHDLASRIIDEYHGGEHGGEHGEELSPATDLSMRFLVIASLILDERTAEARLELGEFLRHFRSHMAEGFEQTWDYSGTKAFVQGREIEPESKELLLLLVDLLERAEPDALEKLESFLGIMKKG